MANFCTNCGSKLEDYYNYCINCGTKIDKSDIKQNNSVSNQYSDSMEKKKAKQKLNMVLGGILSSDDSFRKTLFYNGLDYVNTRKAIKQQVEKEIDSGQIKSEEVEYRVNQLIIEYKTKMEEEKARIAKEEENKKEMEKARIAREKAMTTNEIKRNGINNGGYCDLSCRHFYEEFLDSGGGITGDYTDDGMVEYYCSLGHSIVYGNFCEDYE